MILLGVEAAASLVAVAAPAFEFLAGLDLLPLIVVFLVWFYQARVNAGSSDWRQRRSPGWAIGAWFVPVVWLWFPFQIMADIWRAGCEPAERTKTAVLPVAWWTCWLLAWFTGVHHVVRTADSGRTVNSLYNLSLGGTQVSRVFVAAAAILLLLIVRTVSSAGPSSGPPLPSQAAAT